MPSFLYYLTTVAESALSVVGIRSPYEQPRYAVVRTLAPDIEVRDYAPRVAVETAMRDGNDGEAFGRLFRYITGANNGKHSIAMTVPVEQSATTIPMTAPVEETKGVMRFFLPAALAGDPPMPSDPSVHIASLPGETLGVIRYSGTASDAARARERARLEAALQAAGLRPKGPPSYLSYDPPFALPFVRRNEVTLPIESNPR